MSGLLRMEAARFSSDDGYAIQSNLSDWDLRLEQLFREQEIVSNLKLSMESFKLRSTELELAEHQLNNLRSVSTFGFHMEAHKDKQENLILRCEGALDGIWKAISGFFGWIVDAITGLFSGDSDSDDSPGGGSSPSEITTNINETLKNTDPSIRTSEYSIAGIASIIDTSSEGAAIASINALGASLRNSPNAGKFLLNRVKELTSSKKGETAPDELKKLLEGLKASDNSNMKSKLKAAPAGEYILIHTDKRSALAIGHNNNELLSEFVDYNVTDDKAELNAASVAAIMRAAAYIPPLVVDFRKHMLNEVKPQANSLKSAVANLPSEAKNEDERRFSISMRIYAKVLRSYLATAMKLTKQGRTVARALDKTSECLKPFIKEKKEETPNNETPQNNGSQNNGPKGPKNGKKGKKGK